MFIKFLDYYLSMTKVWQVYFFMKDMEIRGFQPKIFLNDLENICKNGRKFDCSQEHSFASGSSKLSSDEIAITSSYSIFMTYVECHTYIMSYGELDKEMYNELRKFYQKEPIIEFI